jgi:hypothetical protein
VVTLTIDPPMVGHVRFAATVREGGGPVTHGQVRIKLSSAGNAALGATFVETTAGAAGYTGAGDLVQTARWRADVLVRTPSDPLDYRDVPFDFTIGPKAAFLGLSATRAPARPANLRLTQTPGGPATLAVHLPAGLQVRYAVSMPSMGTAYYPAGPRAQGWYSGTLTFPMAGVVEVAVQVRHGGGWQQARLLRYRVDARGTAHVVGPSA